MTVEKNIKWIAAAVGAVVILVVLWILYALFLCLGMDAKEAVTTLIALGGVVAVVIGIFQTNKRITQQEKQGRDARFAAGVELLGNPHESTRIGGAYNLYFLARDFEEYRAPVCEILCAHIRTVTGAKEYRDKYAEKPSNEVQTIISLLFWK
jgi:hypothetical protein